MKQQQKMQAHEVIRTAGRGSLNDELTEHLQITGMKLRKEAIRSGVKQKAKISVTFVLVAEANGEDEVLASIGYEIKRVEPPPLRRPGNFFISRDGEFVTERPQEEAEPLFNNEKVRPIRKEDQSS